MKKHSPKAHIDVKKYFIAFAMLCAAVFLLAKAQSIGEGIRAGIKIALEQVIPSLYPFMILTILLGNLQPLFLLPQRKDRHRRVLPPGCLPAILMSMIGGYPAGLKLISDMRERNQITPEHAEILSAFCFNSGPAFLLSVVGKNMFGATRAGIFLLAATSLSSIFCAFATMKNLKPQTENKSEQAAAAPLGNILVSAVSSAAHAVCSAALWICLFQGVIFGLEDIFGALPEQIRIFMEVTDGCSICAQRGNLPLAAAACAFGGFCVHCQILPFLQKCKIKYRYFFKYRLYHSLLSYFVCWLLIKIFPIAASAQPIATSGFRFDGFSVCILLLLSAALIWDTAPNIQKSIPG